jgi:hypothetical protein
MAIQIVMIGMPQIAVGVDLDDAQTGIMPGMRPNGSQRSRVLAGQGHQEPAGSDMRTHKRLDRFYRLTIDLAL